MSKALQFPYTIINPALGESSSLPYLPFTLQQPHTVSVTGLVDSGAMVNVLPFSSGLQLGLNSRATNSPGPTHRQSGAF